MGLKLRGAIWRFAARRIFRRAPIGCAAAALCRFRARCRVAGLGAPDRAANVAKPPRFSRAAFGQMDGFSQRIPQGIKSGAKKAALRQLASSFAKTLGPLRQNHAACGRGCAHFQHSSLHKSRTNTSRFFIGTRRLVSHLHHTRLAQAAGHLGFGVFGVQRV